MALPESGIAFRLTNVVSEDDVLPLTATIYGLLFIHAARHSACRSAASGDNMRKSTANVHQSHK